VPKISQFPSGGVAQNTDLIPVVRNGGDYTITGYNLASLASYGQAYVGTFTATAGQTVFTLPASPGSLANLAISVDGAVMVPSTDYTWTTPTTLTFTTGLSSGQTVLYRYTTSVPVGTAIAGGVNGQLLYNNSGIVNGTTIGGDATLVATTGVLTVTKTNGVAFAASATTNTTVTGNITYTQGGTGATSRTVTSKLQESVSVLDFGADPTGSADSTTAFNNAITAASRVLVPAGTYLITGTITVAGTLDLIGQGVGVTTVKKTTASTGHILDALSGSNKTDIYIAGITFDVNNIDSAIAAQYVTLFTVSDCRFTNINHWGIWVGVSNGADTVIRNDNILIQRCTFDTSTATYEQILPFNSKNVTIRDCTFTTGASAIGIGLYQNLDNVLIQRCRFFGTLNTGTYYSLSCNNITIDECVYETTAGLKGANQSDNGAFGYTQVKNLLVAKTRFTGCTSPLQLGAVNGAVIKQCVFDQNLQFGAIVNAGNTPVSAACVNYVFDSCIFSNNNVSNISSGNAPGLRFDSVGGTQNAVISKCVFYDDRGTPYQLYPITFTNAYTWSNVSITDCVLNAYSGGLSVGLISSAAFGSNVFIGPDNQALTASMPSGLATNLFKTAVSGNRVTVTYSASMTFDASLGSYFRIIVTDGNAFTINAPSNPTTGQRITVIIENSAGGALGTATWNTVFKLATWTQPANLYSRSIDFTYNGGNWVETCRTTTDVPR